MLKVLLKKQLFEIFRSYFYDAKKNKARSKGAIVGYIVMFVAIMVGILGVMFTALANNLCGAFVPLGLDVFRASRLACSVPRSVRQRVQYIFRTVSLEG